LLLGLLRVWATISRPFLGIILSRLRDQIIKTGLRRSLLSVQARLEG
jgi:hypothetical protein